ncbi:hypothetical protein BDW22DRAFT_1362973 [Trametopsis cervina]|nr:hypothetical protein BDW22DRAFT_1362973 [Trametopsis cervina]
MFRGTVEHEPGDSKQTLKRRIQDCIDITSPPQGSPPPTRHIRTLPVNYLSRPYIPNYTQPRSRIARSREEIIGSRGISRPHTSTVLAAKCEAATLENTSIASHASCSSTSASRAEHNQLDAADLVQQVTNLTRELKEMREEMHQIRRTHHINAQATPLIKSGIYRLVNAKSKTDLYCPHHGAENRGVPLRTDAQNPSSGKDGLMWQWCITQLLNGHYLIENTVTGLFANCWKFAQPGDSVVCTLERQEFSIRHTEVEDQYTIETVDPRRLRWAAEPGGASWPGKIALRQFDTVGDTYWIFEPVVNRPSEEGAC